jgi:hypothetical protein
MRDNKENLIVSKSFQFALKKEAEETKYWLLICKEAQHILLMNNY